jgi:hypothetical protein
MESIDRIPASIRQRSGENFTVQRAVDLEGTSQLVLLYRNASKATLTLSFLRTLKRARGFPRRERLRQLRRNAELMAAEIFGRDVGGCRPPETAYGKTFTVVSD